MRPVVFGVLIVALGLRAPDVNAAERAADPSFAALVEEGDRAVAEWRLKDAAKAYAAAFQLRQDPTVLGRWGLLVLDLGDEVAAAHKLLEALEGGGGAHPAERARFYEAYTEVRAKVCRLDVSTTAGAEVRIDGQILTTAAAHPDFFRFVLPGEHELQARLKGYAMRRVIVITRKGTREHVPLELAPLPADSEEDAEVRPKKLPADDEEDAEVRPKKKPRATSSPPRFPNSPAGAGARLVLGGGAVAAWGSAPGVAGGALAFGAARWEAFSLGGEVRGVLSFQRLLEAPSLLPWSWSLTVPACWHRSAGFLCGLAELEGNGISFVTSFQSVVAGVGVRGGAEFPLSLWRGVHVRIWGDGLLRAPAPFLTTGRVHLWQGLPFGVAAGVALGTTL